MLYSAAALHEIVSGQQIFGIVITDAFQSILNPVSAIKVYLSETLFSS